MNERSWIELDLSNFTYNIEQIKSKSLSSDFMQIVKADAYGHGAFEISRKAISLGAKYLGVANITEAKALRLRDINIPILILSPSLNSEIDEIIKYNITPTVSSYNFCDTLHKKAKRNNQKINIHINIDTGMGRSGFTSEEFHTNFDKIQKMKFINIEGIYTHLSSSETDENYSLNQYKSFIKLLSQIQFKPKFVHLANSVASIKYNFPEANIARLGLLSYGIYPNDNIRKIISLKQVMSFHTKISQIKTAEIGEPIGYNRTYIAKSKTKYAVLPVGYADGYDFLLSNKGVAQLHNQLCPVIGKISMDMTTIDVSNIESVQIGDEVLLLSNEVLELNADKIVAIYNGLSYELLCQLGRRAKRFYREDKKIITSSPISHRDIIFSDFNNNKLNNVIETALKQRLDSSDFSAIVYQEFLKDFFFDSDEKIFYRENFNHSIKFSNSQKYPNYFLSETELQFSKRLQNDFFYIVCASNENELYEFLNQRDVEYRWLLDDKILQKDSFKITNISINNIPLNIEIMRQSGFIKIKCNHPKLSSLVNKKVHFSISTQTYHPKKSHQFSVFISEITKNVKIRF
ncbi:MAG: alanine racemase, partial [Candidatus Cloacimonadota bacterium]|nr:alanine racemase [Candidatus Cloacimonadota bacterium]